MMSTKSSGPRLGIGIVVVALVLIAAYLVLKHRHETLRHFPASAQSAPAAPTTVPPPEHHPISKAQVSPAEAGTAPLPALDNSDEPVADALARIGGSGVRSLLVSSALIPRMVAAVNALPGKTLPENVMPVKGPKGNFKTTKSGTDTVADTGRYMPYVQSFEQADTQAMVAWYVHYYPLFQQAWKQLGVPHKSFNDRLVEVIDQLLATPNLQQPARLVAESGAYRFSNPDYESRSIGQKLMLRLGPDDEAKVKTKLHAIRVAITGEQAPATTSSAAQVNPLPSGG